MPKKRYIMAIDQGTTSSKAILLDHEANVLAVSDNAYVEPLYPRAGWVEYDPRRILESVLEAGWSVIKLAGILPSEIAMIGLANQGETVIAFHRDKGEPVYPAISWQDRRTSKLVAEWRGRGLNELTTRITGLKLDPYFSASKIRWLLDQVDEARSIHKSGKLCAATSDAWLIHRLTNGRNYVTDTATASRTMLLNLAILEWDVELSEHLGIPLDVLPELISNDTIVGEINKEWFGCPIPLGGLCVDQQAALFGQGCHQESQAKISYGTGCFMLANMGPNPDVRVPGLLTSVGWRIEDEVCYVLDGGVYTAGTLVNWLISDLKLAASLSEIEQLMKQSDDPGDLYFIPALSGLAAPYWEPESTGAWLGLSLRHDRTALIRSALEGIAFRVKDIFDLITSAAGRPIQTLKSDGGLVRNCFLMQFQADLLGVPLEAADMVEATAYGVGLISGQALGFWSARSDAIHQTKVGKRYLPHGERQSSYLQRYRNWRQVVEEIVSWRKRGIPASR